MRQMNIADLLSKARSRAPTVLGPKPGFVLTSSELEAFAELVVLECTKVVEDQRDPPTLNYKPSQQISESIKRHFGV